MPVKKTPRILKLHKLDVHYETSYRNVMGRHWPVVHGLGDVMSPVVFVDAVPRRTDDHVAKPYLGQSGALFTKLLCGIGLERTEIFYTYLNKFAAENKVQLPEVAHIAGHALLHWELEILRPRLVVLMGVRVARVFCPDIDSDGLNGQTLWRTLHQGYRTRVMPIVHPSNALLSNTQRRRTDKHFALIEEALGVTHGALHGTR